MGPKAHGFASVFHGCLSLGPGLAQDDPIRPVLFHIVRRQHMMPNVIRGRFDWYRLSSDVFNFCQLFRTAAECQQGSREAAESNDCSDCRFVG